MGKKAQKAKKSLRKVVKAKKRLSATKTARKQKRRVQILARVTTESVYKHTNKHWDEWIKILSQAGGKNMDFTQINKWMASKHRKISAWWRMQIAIGYETHIGRRIEGRNQKGEFSVTISKNLPVSRQDLWAYLTSEQGQNQWLKPLAPIGEFAPKIQFEVEGGIFGEIRTLKAPERLRLSWQDTEWLKPSIVQIYIGVPATATAATKSAAPSAAKKCTLVIMHEALKDGRLRMQMRDYWRAILNDVYVALT